MPFIVQKIGQAPISDHERSMQSIIREKINGVNMAVSKSRGALLTDLLHELRKLKEEIEDRKFGNSPVMHMLFYSCASCTFPSQPPVSKKSV